MYCQNLLVCLPLKDKTGKSITKALKPILEKS